MEKYNILVKDKYSTIVSEYIPIKNRKSSYQTENDLEIEFINDLKEQGYEYLAINNETQLKLNLRDKIERLNNFQFSDEEWNSFYNSEIANSGLKITDKSEKIQRNEIIAFLTKDNVIKNIKLIDKRNINNNYLQVINQYRNDEGKYKNRYDVTILVNGFPLVHIELKRRGVRLTEAFNQIERYRRDSFWAEDGLFEYVQLYVISNGTRTKYYSNTVREDKFKSQYQINKDHQYNNFKFTSFWTDGKNNHILDLKDFTKTFFSKHVLLNLLTKYCVFTSEKRLLAMRPYQICATEAILRKVNTTMMNQLWSKENSGGYIWHTTGSGKTL
ncbi:MAG: type I restriction endonuclease, partial [Mycoplasmoidaceae bacterium]